MANPFDARATSWDGDPGRLQLADHLFSALDQRLPLRPEWTALDYGCGTGLLTLALASRLRRVLAVDSSRGMLDVLEHKIDALGLPHVDTLHADFEHAPLPDGPFDLIASAMTLHHVGRIGSLFQSFSRLLAPDGRLALFDLDVEDGTFHATPDGVRHNGFHRDDLARALADAGFQDVDFTTATRIEKHGRAYPVFLATARRNEK
jgi:ubiquinone/menaquinone biosynthesis C-methylase UbiE